MKLTPAKIKAIRKRLGLTMREAGERCFVSEANWSRYESGKTSPSKTAVFLINLLASGKVPA